MWPHTRNIHRLAAPARPSLNHPPLLLPARRRARRQHRRRSHPRGDSYQRGQGPRRRRQDPSPLSDGHLTVRRRRSRVPNARGEDAPGRGLAADPAHEAGGPPEPRVYIPTLPHGAPDLGIE